MAQGERKRPGEGMPKGLEGGIVDNTLDPRRAEDKLRSARSRDGAGGVDPVADLAMSRHTDAPGTVLPWLVGAAGLILVVAAVAFS